ncbi:MAG: NBR1-Ig-like domain-containing protein [Anaerolineales bacterium]|nr:NBR1-Ig-like domain-containing protein [Anaerolineales bacterium]
MSRKIHPWAATLLLIALLTGACNFPGRQLTENAYPTFAAQTVEARLTLAVQATLPPLLPLATNTQPPPQPTLPEPTGSPTNTAIPTQTSVPCDRAVFVNDVTIPDGTLLAKGESFTKTWRLRNTGSCSWNSSYQLIFKEGDSMSGPASKSLTGGTVAPGQTVDISVDLKAPNSNGEYRGDWLIRSDAGIVFGIGTGGDVAFYLEIKVAEPTATPYPILASDGDLDLDQTYAVDLDTGSVGATGDLWFQAVSPAEKYLAPTGGAMIKRMGGSVPSLENCLSASLSTAKIPLADVSVGDWLCFETNQGNVGRIEIEGITPGPTQTLQLDFKTWDT